MEDFSLFELSQGVMDFSSKEDHIRIDNIGYRRRIPFKKNLSNYEIVKYLGDGSFGSVILGQKDGKNYALKVIDVSKIMETKNSRQMTSQLRTCVEEAYIMKEINPLIDGVPEISNAVCCYDFFFTMFSSKIGVLEIGKILPSFYCLGMLLVVMHLLNKAVIA